MGCPLVTYIKEGEEEAGQEGRRAMGGSPTRTPNLVGFGPPFLLQLGEGGKEEERRKEGGTAPTLIQFGLVLGGIPHLLDASSYLPLKPM